MLLANATIVFTLSMLPLSLAQLPHTSFFFLVLLLFGEKQSKSYSASRQVSSGSKNYKFVKKKNGCIYHGKER